MRYCTLVPRLLLLNLAAFRSEGQRSSWCRVRIPGRFNWVGKHAFIAKCQETLVGGIRVPRVKEQAEEMRGDIERCFLFH